MAITTNCRPHNDPKNMVRKQEPDGSWKVFCKECLGFVGRIPKRPCGAFPEQRYHDSLAAIEVLK